MIFHSLTFGSKYVSYCQTILIGFAIALLTAALVNKLIPLPCTLIYVLAGAEAIATVLYVIRLSFYDLILFADTRDFVHENDVQPEIWSYGHRHSQGIVYDTKYNKLTPMNMVLWGPMNSTKCCREKTMARRWPPMAWIIPGLIVSPLKEYPGTEQPLVQWTPSLAPLGLTQCGNCQWPEWDDDLLVGWWVNKSDVFIFKVIPPHRRSSIYRTEISCAGGAVWSRWSVIPIAGKW